jgi:hypothetical protein
LLTLASAILVHLVGGGHLADENNTRILLDQPGATLARAAILQYRPVNTDVLPIFVLLHLLFAPLLWLLLRVPNVTLGASLALYALVHVFGWSMPAWPNGHWAFNPLCLAASGCTWRVVDDRGRESAAVGDVTHGVCTCRSLSGVQPHHRIELEDQTTGRNSPAGAAETVLSHG